MLSRCLKLGRQFLFSPAQGAEAADKEENFLPSLWIYIAFLAGTLFFFRFKPFDFPEKNAPFPREIQDFFFWLKVTFWQPPLEAGWIIFLMGLTQWFKQGSWPTRFILGVAWAALPFISIVAYTQSAMPRIIFAAGFFVWAGLFYPAVRSVSRKEWLGLASFMLGLNAIGIVLLIPMSLAVLIDQPAFFTFSQAAGGLWILGVGTLGLRALTGLRLPRAFMAVLLSMFFQIALAFYLHLSGIVPKEILKALFYA